MTLSAAICSRIRLYAEGVRHLMEEDKEVQVLGIADNDDEIRNLVQYSPDIVIVTDLESCKIALEFFSGNEDSKLLLVNGINDLDNQDIKGMIENGLRGILPKDAKLSLLKKAVTKIHEGEVWFDNQTVRDVLSMKEKGKKEVRLTKKETEILNHICTGLTNKEIAQKLYISEQTVKSHCNHLFKKFDVKSRLKLAVTAPQCLHEGFINGNLQQ